MKVENAVYPRPEPRQELMTRNTEGPLVMVNLLKFRDKAEYKDGRADDISGPEAYMRWVNLMKQIVEREGGRCLRYAA